MTERPSTPAQVGVLVAIVAGFVVLQYLLVELLPLVGAVLPGWFVGMICVGFLCSVPLIVIGFLLFVPVFWLLAALADRGYLPDAW